MVRIQRVEQNLDGVFNGEVIDPYNKIKNNMNVLKSRSSDLKLKTRSSATGVYLYVLIIFIALVGLATKSNILLLFSSIVLAGVVLINILHLVL